MTTPECLLSSVPLEQLSLLWLAALGALCLILAEPEPPGRRPGDRCGRRTAEPEASWLLAAMAEGYACVARGREWSSDGGLVLLGHNRAWEDLTGQRSGSAPGALLADCLPVEAAQLQSLVQQALAAPGSAEMELRFEATGRWTLARAHLRADGTVAVLLTDTSARHHAEGMQRLASLGRLAASVTHELNNLLSGLIMTAELTRYVRTQESYDELVDTVRELVPRGADLCRNITTFSRPEEPRCVPLDLDEAVDAALSLAAHHTRDMGITIQRDAGSRQHLVHGDRGQLEQVFLNLFINASQAMRHGGELTVRSWFEVSQTGEEQVIVTVADTGSGIDPDHLPHIFDPYFTTKSDRPTAVGGTGLGLAVSREIVLRHGGTIEVDSDLGAGTTFELRFPACRGGVVKTDADEDSLVAALKAVPQGLRVLLVEDQPQFRHAVTRILRLAGVHVLATDSPHQAWALLQAAECDLVITDVTMPGGGGRQVLTWARRGGSPPPVLAVTGWADESVADDLVRLGACCCLRKPFDMTELVEAITMATAGT